MRRRFRRPLRRSLVISCLLFICVLSVLVGIKSYNRLRHAVIERHTAYITDLLRFTAANIDVDDLENCLETGTESEKFRQLQLLLNRIKDTHGIDFIYVIIPLHSGAHDNVMNVIAGLSSDEEENNFNTVRLGELTGDSYPVDAVIKGSM